MNILDIIKRKFTARTFFDPNEAYFPNRHERRARGIKFPVGLVPAGLSGFVQESLDLRYVVRHWAQATSPVRTRRNRKALARSLRSLRKQGRLG